MFAIVDVMTSFTCLKMSKWQPLTEMQKIIVLCSNTSVVGFRVDVLKGNFCNNEKIDIFPVSAV